MNGALIVGFVLATSSTVVADAKVDWAKGFVTAEGVGIADRHAPSPAVARGTARRGAEDAARKAIALALPALPLAAGGTIADRATDKVIKERIDRAVASAIALTADPETDGAWRVTMAVPLEAIRQAIDGPRALTASDDGPPVVIVEGVKAKPAIGWRVGGKPVATLWVASAPGWAKDAPRVQSTGATAGDIAVIVRTNPPSGSPATLFVVLTE